jgi:hypothetical protein
MLQQLQQPLPPPPPTLQQPLPPLPSITLQQSGAHTAAPPQPRLANHASVLGALERMERALPSRVVAEAGAAVVNLLDPAHVEVGVGGIAHMRRGTREDV